MADNYCYGCEGFYDAVGTWSDCPKHEQCYVLTCDICDTTYPDCEDCECDDCIKPCVNTTIEKEQQ